MSYRRINIWKSVDWITIAIYLVLIFAGLLSIYGSSYEFDNTSIIDYSGRAGKQLVWIGTSLILAFFILMLDKDSFNILAYVFYGVVICLLIATVFLAPDIKGSRSWLILGPVNLQSAEFAKFAVALAVAKRISSYNFKLLEIKNFLSVAFLIILPMVLILLQKETGSALVYIAFLIVLYREGMSGSILVVVFSFIVFFIIGLKYSEVMWGLTPVGEFVVIILIVVMALLFMSGYRKDAKSRIACQVFAAICLVTTAVYLIVPFNLVYSAYVCAGLLAAYFLFLSVKEWSRIFLLMFAFIIGAATFLYSVDYVFDEVLEPHQQVRIKVTLGMEDDPSGAGYNVNQSKIAIGSGGFLGKGFLNGTQTKLKYVPEQDTDFIFCTVGEEQGFVGSSIVLILFAVMIVRLIVLAERQKEVFNRVYGYSVASILFFHLMINIGMVIGLTPVIGIPLPFFSYGGSSLWGFTILLFIFLKLDGAKSERL